MWFNFTSKRIAELEDALREQASTIFDLQSALCESQQFERIAAEKLRVWVEKHDQLLMDFKEYKANNKQKV